MTIQILAIESSCDDTAAAIMRDGALLSNITASQTDHKDFGGVVPELASRAHSEYIWPVVHKALQEANVDIQSIDAIACTRGPGLMGSLLVGYTFAKTLAMALEVPFIGVNHMKAHILAHFIERPHPIFPFICLTVSGGHTQLVIVRAVDDMEIIGQTLDDAAGEAFDKAGKLLGLSYPAGPEIDKLAQKGKPIFDLPEPQVPGYNFSFSGLKTAFRYFIRDNIALNPHFVGDHLHDLCSSIQTKIIAILITKLKLAAQENHIDQVAIAGGVSANSGLRNALKRAAEIYGWQIYVPKLPYCTDNAAMVAMAAHFAYLKGEFTDLDSVADPRMAW